MNRKTRLVLIATLVVVMGLVSLGLTPSTTTAQTLVPDLQLTKTHTGTAFTVGSTGTYTLTLTNIGGAAAPGPITVTDNLPGGMTVNAFSAAGWSCPAPASQSSFTCTYTATGGNLAIGASSSFSVTVNVPLSAVPNQTNTADAAPVTGETAFANNHAVDIGGVPVVAPNLQITSITQSPPQFVDGSPGQYNITVTNVGTAPTTGAPNIHVDMTFPPGFGYVAAGSGGTNWTCPGADSAPKQTQQTITCDYSQDITPSGPVSFVVNLSFNHTAPPGQTFTATVRPVPNETNTSDNSRSITSSVSGVPDMSIAVTQDPVPNLVVGTQGTYTVQIKNNGSLDASIGTVSVSLTFNGSNITVVDGAGAAFTCVPGITTIICTNTLGAIARGGGSTTITVHVNPTAAGANSLSPSVTASGEPSTYTGDNTITPPIPINVVAAPNLTLQPSGKAASSSTFTIGAPGQSYTLTVVNNGGGATVQPITVTDNLPPNLSLQSFSSSTGDWNCSGTTSVTCTKTTPLAAGATTIITLVVNVGTGTAASIQNTASVQTFGDSQPADNTSNTVTTTVKSVALTAQKTHSGTFAVAGTPPVFTFTVTNTGTGPTVGNIVISDPLPTGLTFNAQTAGGPNWTCLGPTTTVTCTFNNSLAPLQPTQQTTVSFSVNVLNTVAASITNTATVATTGITTLNVSDGPITVQRPDLIINKSHADPFSVGVNGDYVITVTNQGTGPTSGQITVTETLPTTFDQVSAGGTGWTCATPGAATHPVAGYNCTLTVIAPLAAGASLPQIVVTVKPTTTTGSPFNNVVSVQNITDVDTSNNSFTNPTNVGAAPPPDLSITKTHTDPFTVGVNGVYTITVVNVGVGVANGNVHVVDNVPATFTVGTVTPNGWTCAVTGLPATGQVLTCDMTATNLAGGNTAMPTIQFQAMPSSNNPSQYTNSVTVSNAGDTFLGNNTATDVTNVQAAALPDLTITKTHATNFTTTTDGVYTITVTNAGTVAATGPLPFTITENLPSTFNIVSVSGTNWTCNYTGSPGALAAPVPSFTCTNTQATIAASGGTLPPLTLTVRATTTTGSPFLNSASVTPATNETNTGNNTANDSTTVTAGPAPDMTVTKTHTGNFIAGQTGTFTITPRNIGSAPMTDPVVVTDVLPAGLTFNTASWADGTCVNNAGTVTCTSQTDIPAGSQLQPISLVVNISASANGQITNTASVQQSVNPADANPNNGSASDTVTITGAVDMSITKAHNGVFQEGTNATWVLTVQNVGGAATTTTTTVTDTIPNGLTPVTASGLGWSCGAAVGQTFTCTHASGIAGGQSSTITITVHVPTGAANPPGPSYTNLASVANSSDNNGTNNNASDTATVSVGPVPDLGITKSHSGTFVIGSNGTFTLNVQNFGNAATSGTSTVTDTLPAGLTFVSGTGGAFSCSAAGQTVTCISTASIAAGQSIPISLVVAVAGPAGTVTNTASVSTPNDPNTSNNTSNTDTVTIAAAPPPSAANSTINAFPTSVAADGFQTTTVTVTVRDTNNNPVPNKTVDLSTDTGLPAGLFISNGGVGTTNASGVVTFTASSTVAQTVNFRATIPSDSVTITNGTRSVTFFSPTGVSATNSTAFASPSTVAADGIQFSTITVTVRNNANQIVPGATVTLTGNPNTGVTVAPGTQVTTDGSGNATFQVRSTVGQTVTFTVQATFNGVTTQLNAQPVVAFTSTTATGVVSATNSKLSTDFISIPADNITFATLTVQLKDGSNNPVANKTVSITANPPLTGMTIQTISGVTNSGGVATFQVRSVTQGGPVTFTATDTTDNIVVGNTVQISFTAPGTQPVLAANVTVTPGGTASALGVALLNPPSEGPSIGIVVPYRLCVRTGPGTFWPAIGRLKQRTQVILLARNNFGTARNFPPRPDCQQGRGGATWFLIQLENGQVGWVSAFYIRVKRLQFRHLPSVDPTTVQNIAPAGSGILPAGSPTATPVPH